jgi:signal transduction histidine kinase/CheY-like chemotaxis protein
MSDPLTFSVTVLFAILFVWAAWNMLRHRDLLARDVVLVFAPIALVLSSGIVRQVVGPLPSWFGLITTVFLLAQPVLVLLLVSDIRRLPRWLLPTASGAVLAVAILIVLTNGDRGVVLAGIAEFVVIEFLAAGYLALEGRRRSGAARVRLAVAAIATGAVAAALLASGTAAAGPAAAAASGIAIRIAALLAAVGYWIAFLPPRPLRELWQETAAYNHSERLLAAPATASSAELWTDLATTAADLTGATTVVLLGNRDSVRVAATSSDVVPVGTAYEVGIEDVLAVETNSLVVQGIVERTQSRSIKVIQMRPDETLIGAILLLRPRPSLFDSDDVALVGSLAIRSAHLVQRREALAEQEELSHRLTETVQALEAASAAKSDFLASMSHELRTPLTAIIGFSSLMAVEPEVDGRVSVSHEWVDHIRIGGDHLLALINDVLDLAKVEAGRLELASEPVDVGSSISTAVAALRPLADRKTQSIEVIVPESLTIEADPGRLRQILYNLLSNSIKYTGERGRILVSAAAGGDRVHISVQDDGVGIAPEDHERVFEEFQQVGDPTQHVSGTGLGLALTRRLVEAHEGTIRLRSRVGEGSTFTVVLPIAHARAIEQPPEPSPGAAADAGRSILVIEDEPSSARLLDTYLREAGYAVRLAADGETGLAYASSDPPAAIVLDVVLPGIDGWEVLRRLKSDPGLRDVPVIVATVVDERGVGLALGAVDYLLKPIDPRALLDRLARHAFPAPAASRPTSVVAIDDDPVALDVIEATLASRGYAVQRATSGRDGISLARTQQPDLVICDLLMPEVDGFEVVSELHEDEATTSIPILVLTAHNVTASEKARLNGRVLGIAAKTDHGADGLLDWLGRVLPHGPDARRTPSPRPSPGLS